MSASQSRSSKRAACRAPCASTRYGGRARTPRRPRRVEQLEHTVHEAEPSHVVERERVAHGVTRRPIGENHPVLDPFGGRHDHQIGPGGSRPRMHRGAVDCRAVERGRVDGARTSDMHGGPESRARVPGCSRPSSGRPTRTRTPRDAAPLTTAPRSCNSRRSAASARVPRGARGRGALGDGRLSGIAVRGGGGARRHCTDHRRKPQERPPRTCEPVARRPSQKVESHVRFCSQATRKGGRAVRPSPERRACTNRSTSGNPCPRRPVISARAAGARARGHRRAACGVRTIGVAVEWERMALA